MALNATLGPESGGMANGGMGAGGGATGAAEREQVTQCGHQSGDLRGQGQGITGR